MVAGNNNDLFVQTGSAVYAFRNVSRNSSHMRTSSSTVGGVRGRNWIRKKHENQPIFESKPIKAKMLEFQPQRKRRKLVSHKS